MCKADVLSESGGAVGFGVGCSWLSGLAGAVSHGGASVLWEPPPAGWVGSFCPREVVLEPPGGLSPRVGSGRVGSYP